MIEHKTRQHFNNIAANYKEEIVDYIRDHLINKLWKLTSYCFPKNGKAIDIGCGDGTNIVFFRSKGINAIGVDFSEKLIKKGKERYPKLQSAIFKGDALNLQFQDNTFDIAFMIGVLHHIHSESKQISAVREALRVVKDNGIIIIRESNLINPFFRIFWNYVFPLTAKIDRFGGENWISAIHLSDLFTETLEKIFYFTFILSFTPQVLFPIASRFENFLEKSALKKLSAHYIVVLRKHKIH